MYGSSCKERATERVKKATQRQKFLCTRVELNFGTSFNFFYFNDNIQRKIVHMFRFYVSNAAKTNLIFHSEYTFWFTYIKHVDFKTEKKVNKG